jgi:hypothetical protein
MRLQFSSITAVVKWILKKIRKKLFSFKRLQNAFKINFFFVLKLIYKKCIRNLFLFGQFIFVSNFLHGLCPIRWSIEPEGVNCFIGTSGIHMGSMINLLWETVHCTHLSKNTKEGI